MLIPVLVLETRRRHKPSLSIRCKICARSNVQIHLVWETR